MSLCCKAPQDGWLNFWVRAEGRSGMDSVAVRIRIRVKREEARANSECKNLYVKQVNVHASCLMPCALCLVPCALCLVIQGDAEGPLTISMRYMRERGNEGTRERTGCRCRCRCLPFAYNVAVLGSLPRHLAQDE